MTIDWSKTYFGPNEPPSGRCVKESDGYHAHLYGVWGDNGEGGLRRFRIEHHMHSWMDEHRQLYPDTRDVDAHTPGHDPLGRFDTVEEAWKALRVQGDTPEICC